jgi:hypothetical protein
MTRRSSNQADFLRAEIPPGLNRAVIASNEVQRKATSATLVHTAPEGSSKPRARADFTVEARRCAPSVAYRSRIYASPRCCGKRTAPGRSPAVVGRQVAQHLDLAVAQRLQQRLRPGGAKAPITSFMCRPLTLSEGSLPIGYHAQPTGDRSAQRAPRSQPEGDNPKMPRTNSSAATTLTVNPYLQGNFAPVRQERDNRDFEVTGTIPLELNVGAVDRAGLLTSQTTLTLTFWGRGAVCTSRRSTP